MCDQDTLEDGRRYEAAAALSRRRFSALSLGAALALTLPRRSASGAGADAARGDSWGRRSL